ncbi:MAG: Maf family protein [Pelagibacteraceae bacterium]
MPKLILASASKRRLDLLNSINIKPDKVIASEINEDIKKREKKYQFLNRIAFEKANKIQTNFPEDIILAADTIVFTNQKVFGKPENLQDARNTLEYLSGRNHTVSTSVCVLFKKIKKIKIVSTKIKFKKLHDQEIDEYLDTKEWEGKAGSYAIQGYAEKFIIKIIGSYSNVVGLPLYETANLLNSLGKF